MAFNILIVDDDLTKIDEICDELRNANLENLEITVSQNRRNALELLKQKQFELIIIDIALPHRDGDMPSPKGGIELLDDLQRGDRYNKPLYVVGLTAHEDLWDELHPYFDNRAWTLLRYRQRDFAWGSVLREFTKYAVSAAQPATPTHKADLCVVTALADPELKAVRQLNWQWSQALPVDETLNVYKGLIIENKRSLSVVAATSLRMGMVDAALLVQKLIHHFHPRYVVMCGICAGKKGSVGIGDVILAQSSWDYQSGKRTRNEGAVKHAPSPDMISVSDAVLSAFAQIQEDKTVWNEIRERWQGIKPDSLMRAHYGPIGTGSAVLADGTSLEEVSEVHRKILGIDMEIYGVYAACRAASSPQPEVFALKSVCDFADGEKDDRFQGYAAYTSAEALRCLVSKLI